MAESVTQLGALMKNSPLHLRSTITTRSHPETASILMQLFWFDPADPTTRINPSIFIVLCLASGSYWCHGHSWYELWWRKVILISATFSFTSEWTSCTEGMISIKLMQMQNKLTVITNNAPWVGRKCQCLTVVSVRVCLLEKYQQLGTRPKDEPEWVTKGLLHA